MLLVLSVFDITTDHFQVLSVFDITTDNYGIGVSIQLMRQLNKKKTENRLKLKNNLFEQYK
jgi:hypothetical protein